MTLRTDRILTSRLHVLQAKRMLLATAQTNLRVAPTDRNRVTVQRRQHDVTLAQGHYAKAVLAWGEPISPQYQLVAYGSLVAKAERLRAVLRSAAPNLPAPDRGELLADVESLSLIIDTWNQIRRNAMAAVA